VIKSIIKIFIGVCLSWLLLSHIARRWPRIYPEAYGSDADYWIVAGRVIMQLLELTLICWLLISGLRELRGRATSASP
jgi:hypothetical protein